MTLPRAERSGRRRLAKLITLAAALVLGGQLLVGPVAAASVVSQGTGSTRVTAAEAADLARQAATDDDALSELRSVRTIDSRPVDLHAATAALGSDRQARLRALADALGNGQAASGANVSPTAARDRANDVLDQPRYKKKEPPKPFEGVLSWLGDRLDPVLGPVGRFFSALFRPIARVIPGGGVVLAVLLAGIVTALVTLLVLRRSGARVASGDAARSLLVDPTADPDELDRQAEAAESAGDLDLAVRRRYEAGLVRLARTGRIKVQADTTASRVAAEVGGEAIEVLTATFERVVYGRVPASAADVAEARHRWVEVIGAKARR